MSITKSKILSYFSNIIHGISTRFTDEPPFFNNLSKHVGDDASAIAKNRERFFGSLGISQLQLVHANQVHGDNIQQVNSPGLYPATDAFITNSPDLFLVISVADCMPVMMFDPVNNAIANIHSGWRGTQKNIARKTVKLMCEKFNSDPAELVVFMGPAISQKNFEVDADVARLFPGEYVIPKPGTEGKFLVDTGRMVFDSLIKEGVKETNIERSTICTYDANNMHSYRRDKTQSGRMFAVLGIKKA
jgi:YfiH family protein